jgi:hypothetical protein
MDANEPGAGGAIEHRDVIVGKHGVSAERDVVSTPVVIGLYAVLVGASIVAAIVVGLVFFALEKRAARTDRAIVAESGLERPAPDRIPPAPRLEIHTVGHWNAFRDAERARLETYGWMDKQTGAVHIPIERAMELITERGVGPLPPGPVVAPAPSAQANPPPVPGSPERKQ